MKCFGWIAFSFAWLPVTVSMAAEPGAARSPRLNSVSVRQAAFARQETKELPAPQGAIVPQAPVHYKLAGDIWAGTHTGYVYAPGSCDFTPPCVNHLWDGYVQMPLRCYGISTHHMRRCGGCDMGCGKCAHGWHLGGKWSCASCGDAAPSCAAPTCAAPSCGCDAGYLPSATGDSAPVGGPPVPMPDAGGLAPAIDVPLPAPDKAARGRRLRGFDGWPTESLQR